MPLLKGHVVSCRCDYPVQHAVPVSAVEETPRGWTHGRGKALCGRMVSVDNGHPSFDPAAGVLDPPCQQCASKAAASLSGGE